MKRLTFSDVDFFYFNRTVGYSSVPKEGFNTIGMDMTHSHHQNLRFNLGQEQQVRKKLFHVDEVTKPAGEVSEPNPGKEDAGKVSVEENSTTPVHRSSPRLNNFKSVSSLFPRSDSLRRNALESSQWRTLSKFVSQINMSEDLERSEEEPAQLTPSQRGVEASPRQGGVCGTRGLTPLSSKARSSLLRAHGIFTMDREQAEVL